jgi:acylpyruvate hydrolase
MRVATIRTPGASAAARVDGETVTVLPYGDVAELLASGRDWPVRAADVSGDTLPLADVQFAPLVPRPEKIFCIGLNYRSHAQEADIEPPKYPTVFAKYWRSLVGPTDPIVLPPNSQMVDWEAELGIVVGTPLRMVDESAALDGIAGYTIVNDISMRDWQLRTSEFLQGKTFEASTPLGPLLVTPDEVDHARRLRLTCYVDDERVQDAYTDDLIFGPAAIVSYLSQFITLTPGDIIATGTPSGVGAFRQPPRYLRDGQTLRTSIEGLGEQRNTCRAGLTSEPDQRG